jgi:multiple sugar transport system substrate-binding protein
MNGVVASADTDHPEAAAKWIEFFTSSPTTVDTRLASSWELPAVNDEAAFAGYLEITPPANRQAVLDALDDIALPPVIERQAELQEAVGQALERIVLDGADIQSTLDEAAAEVDSLS